MRAVKDVETRWNSTYSMLARAVYLQEAINMWTRSTDDYKNLVLTSHEWQLVEFLVHFLYPFKKTTMLLQSTSIPTLQQSFETYENLFNSIDNVRGVFQEMRIRPDWIQDIETGMDEMWTKLREYYSEGKPYAYGDAIILHPSMKTKWFRQHEWDPKVTEEYIESTRSRFNKEYTPQHSKRSYSEIDDDSDSSGQEENEFSIYTSYKRISRVDNPLAWWKDSGGFFPSLQRMARDTFAVPATGSGVEREFSISGNIVNARRNRLSPKTISDLMQFKRWATRTGKVTEFLQG
jgi:hAT family C-terminal dimerisation region